MLVGGLHLSLIHIYDRPDSDDPDAPRVDPVQLDDGRGHTVRIVGTVDRVDTMELGLSLIHISPVQT